MFYRKNKEYLSKHASLNYIKIQNLYNCILFIILYFDIVIYLELKILNLVLI